MKEGPDTSAGTGAWACGVEGAVRSGVAAAGAGGAGLPLVDDRDC